MIEVIRPGLLSTVQDLGRPGLAHLGVARSGALDPGSLRLGNRLVGNPAGTSGIETTMLGIDVRIHRSSWIAVTGATCHFSVDGRPANLNAPQYVPSGGTISLGSATEGIRNYLTVAGGVTSTMILGSRSTDTLSGIGPSPLATGTVLPIGDCYGHPAAVDIAPRPQIPHLATVRLILGPRETWFAVDALEKFFASTYVVTNSSNRVGARLDGPPLIANCSESLPSEGMVLGAVQVPSNGRPIIFLADHPTTGGYPVVGVIHPDDLWMIAQAPPGTKVRFKPHAAAAEPAAITGKKDIKVSRQDGLTDCR